MLPDTYSELYPGRFMRADNLKGGKITLTIKNVDVQELVGENNKKAAKVIAEFERPKSEAFKKIPLELVLPKTNGECLRRMFGNNPHAWIGKRVTLYPSKTSFGRETVDCIRVWGSPDIPEDMPITVPQGRKKALEMVMHRVGPTQAKSQTQSTIQSNPRIDAAFEILGWTDQEKGTWISDHSDLTPDEVLSQLNRIIEQMDSSEQ